MCLRGDINPVKCLLIWLGVSTGLCLEMTVIFLYGPVSFSFQCPTRYMSSFLIRRKALIFNRKYSTLLVLLFYIFIEKIYRVK